MSDLSAAQESEASPRRQPPIFLTSGERVAIEIVVSPASSHGQRVEAYRRLALLLAPLETAIKRFQMPDPIRYTVRRAVVCTMQATNTAYGAWDTVTWFGAARLAGGIYASRLLMLAYELGCVAAADVLGFGVEPKFLAQKFFGRGAIDRELQRVLDYLARVGYRNKVENHCLLSLVLSRLLLLAGKPSLEAISFDLVEEAHRQAQGAARLRTGYFRLARMLYGMGIIPNELHCRVCHTDSTQDTNPNWVQWSSRWKATSTLAESTRQTFYYNLTKVGRWLAVHHPEVQSPDQWTRELAIEFIAATNKFTCGEFAAPSAHQNHRRGIPLSATAKRNLIETLRVFFRDCQDWGWAQRRFDPSRTFAIPRAIAALISPRPRVIADDVWARLLWAGLHLEATDLTCFGGFGGKFPATAAYPLAMVRALAITWLFAGLRCNELGRLRVGCVRWQRHDGGPAAARTPRDGAICLLDVPVHKTGEAFTKPVDPAVGEAIAVWEAERPVQPSRVDPKTGEQVALLFCYRGQPITDHCLNKMVIPILCRKAGVSTYDARGNITSHRARATIATQLYNAKEPMSLFELQAWLGHRSPATTQHYAQITPTTLSKAYADANYFARNVRAIEVLIDQDAIKSAAAANGVPWRYYDLGHGLCEYEFFEQCPHRMACPRCDFYKPKDSSRVQLFEAKSNLMRLLQELPLTEDERAAVDGDLAALDRLAERLAEQPTPSGPTPKQLNAQTKPSS